MHTPGPWKPTTTYGESTNEPFIVWCDGVGAAIAHVYNRSEMGSDNHATQRANARLIAQAPNLLDLLTESLMYVEECEGYHKESCRTLSKRIRAAIEAINPTK